MSNGTVLGANSLLNKDTEEYEIWAGSPAKKDKFKKLELNEIWVTKIFKNNKKVIKILIQHINSCRSRDSIMQFAGIYLAKIFNNKFNLDCIVLSDKHENSDIIKFYKVLDFKNLLKFSL